MVAFGAPDCTPGFDGNLKGADDSAAVVDAGNGNLGVGGVTVMAGEPSVEAPGRACSGAFGCAPVPKVAGGKAGVLEALGCEVPFG